MGFTVYGWSAEVGGPGLGPQRGWGIQQDSTDSPNIL